MTIARSLTKPNSTINVEFPEERTMHFGNNGPDFKWDHSTLSPEVDPYQGDDEPTVKIQVPVFHNQVVVEEETRYPGVGMVIAIAFGAAFWGEVFYLLWR